MVTATNTIAAIATPPGRGGIGVIRVSGPATPAIAMALLGALPQPRYATYRTFLDHAGGVIDRGLAIYFPAPFSYTGEDVLELHAHGSPVALDLLLHRLFALGARPAQPGEFTERAFLNGKIDLAQAEAVADLIAATTAQAARSAVRSLVGEYSGRIHHAIDTLVELRVYAEAAIDFADEEIDFLAQGQMATRLAALRQQLVGVRRSARQGQLLHEGCTMVIAGRPNAGKSTLLNRLAGTDTAIVTAVPGTTRDLLRERIQLDGVPLHLVDTAGLHDTTDPVEQEGIRRARAAMHNADRILLVIDATAPHDPADLLSDLPGGIGITCIYNKIDLTPLTPALDETGSLAVLRLSAQTGAGLDLLHQHLKNCLDLTETTEDVFAARRRHVLAIDQAELAIARAQALLAAAPAPELIAEDLRCAQQALSEITGAFSADDLLGEIFGAFCIGK